MTVDLPSQSPDSYELLFRQWGKTGTYSSHICLEVLLFFLKRAMQDCSWHPVYLDHCFPVHLFVTISSQSFVVDACWPNVWLPSVALCVCLCVCVSVCLCECLIKMSLDLAVTSSVGALIVWQSANKPLMLWEGNRKKATGLRTSINEPPIQRLIAPPGTMIVLTHHPPPLWSWFPHFLCSVLRWVAAGNTADKWSKKNIECARDRWNGGCAA